MSSEFDPVPEPRDALVPPVRRPPTAVGTATPPPHPSRTTPVRMHRSPWLLRVLERGVHAALDAADTVGDAIREAVGLSSRPDTAVVVSRPDDRA